MKISRRHLALVLPFGLLSSCRAPDADPMEKVSGIPMPKYPTGPAANQLSQRFLTFVDQELNSMKQSTYTHMPHIDSSHGIYDTDSSGFVGYSLQAIAPEAYQEIPLDEKYKRPLAKDFVKFFQNLNNSKHWESVKSVDDLQAGDVIAWSSVVQEHQEEQGHVMAIAWPPSENEVIAGTKDIRVIDSSLVEHADDTRNKGQAAVGSGMISLQRSATKLAAGYYWRADTEPMVSDTIVAARLK